MPNGASVSNFSMWINGKEMVGEVVEKQRAREIYDSYKQKRRDPGLLEQNDYKSFEMRVFPIAPGAEQRVQVTYYQELEDGKLGASRSSIDAFVDALGDDDRFEVMSFNVAPQTVFRQLRAADRTARGEAVEFLRSQRAQGGTVLRPFHLPRPLRRRLRAGHRRRRRRLAPRRPRRAARSRLGCRRGRRGDFRQDRLRARDGFHGLR